MGGGGGGGGRRLYCCQKHLTFPWESYVGVEAVRLVRRGLSNLSTTFHNPNLSLETPLRLSWHISTNELAYLHDRVCTKHDVYACEKPATPYLDDNIHVPAQTEDKRIPDAVTPSNHGNRVILTETSFLSNLHRNPRRGAPVPDFLKLVVTTFIFLLPLYMSTSLPAWIVGLLHTPGST